MGRVFELAGIPSGAVRASFELCARLHTEAHPVTATAIQLLPAQKRPYLHALFAFAAMTDQIADELTDDETRRIDQWSADTLTDLRRRCSRHPVRRAFVHLMDLWELDVAVVEELLAAVRKDSQGPARFASITELRDYLRGVSGTVGVLMAPILEPITNPAEAQRLMSLLGEAFQLTDIIEDYPIDLARGDLYLPLEDLDRLGLTEEDLTTSTPCAALDALVDSQVNHARVLLEEAAPVVHLMHPSSQPFLRIVLAGCRLYLDKVAQRKSAAFRHPVRPDLPGDPLCPQWMLLHEVPAPVGGHELLPVRAQKSAQTTLSTSTINTPRHIALIMDGNRRWAASHNRTLLEGHAAGEEAMWRLADIALEFRIPYVSLFAFSTENWTRSQAEITGIFDLLSRQLARRLPELRRKGIRLLWSGRRDRIPASLTRELESAEDLTYGNSLLTVNLCIDYGGRQELVDATRRLAVDVALGRLSPADIDDHAVAAALYQPGMPDVDLLIRTSGEQRISNFLIWQATYAEIVFDDIYWPDFGKGEFAAAIATYSLRKRRFGGRPEHSPSRPSRAAFPEVQISQTTMCGAL
jgi:undecaprenyl diphosphate synthase